MTELAEVFLWGGRIGFVSLSDNSSASEFEYDKSFVGAGVEPSPIAMPVNGRSYSFPELREETFHSLPGMLADSLPDKFGSAVLDAWLVSHGRTLDMLSPIERLCYLGSRGMGALEYRPAKGITSDLSDTIQVGELFDLAFEVLKVREAGRAALLPCMKEYGPILKVGASAGGARAKAIIGWKESTGEVRSGQVKLPDGFGYWLMKFDGVHGNGDKDGEDAKGYGRVEYAYSMMAKAAGIEMSECRLWDGAHFMTRRFDRTSNGGKIHMQTLGALAHFDYNMPRQYSYEQAFRVLRAIVNDIRAEEELFRRMVFNVFAWNCDDHVKNISFLMDRDGMWRLSPAYDLTYSYNPGSRWTSGHQMSIAGKNTGIGIYDLMAVAKDVGLKESRARQIIQDVITAVERWSEFAGIAGVDERKMKLIEAKIKQNDY